MGEVYRATDTKLNRSVAIKRMADSVRSDPAQRRRFIKEAERASQLTDPHIAALYDIIEDNSEVFLVMEFVEGSNLRDCLSRAKNLKDFLVIAIQAAEGLRSAHAHHIVHCDIKPENIMVTPSGQVKILDFGLARQVAKPDSQSFFTSAIVGLWGTPGYIAPEIMLEQEPTPRSDMFSLGVVFYEVLAGKNPFRKKTIFETADSTLREEPPCLESLGLPSQLSGIVARMMDKDPAKRYATEDELIADLQSLSKTSEAELTLSAPSRKVPANSKWRSLLGYPKQHPLRAALLVLVIVIVLASVALFRNARNLGLALGVGRAPHVAVIPFHSIGSDQSQQAFAEGMSDIITSELTQLSDRYALQVVPANEVRSGQIKSARVARQQFGVDLVVEGSLQSVANMTRATYSVVDARTGRQLQAGTVTVPAGDPFGLQDQLASSIVRALGLDVSKQDQTRLATRGTAVSAAYDDYLQGLGYLEDYQKKENIELAIAAFNRGLHHDGNFAMGYAGLGEAHWQKFRNLKDPSALSDAAMACKRALAIDSNSIEAHRCLGEVYGSTGKYKEAAQELELAVAGRPTDDESVRALGMAYEQLGEFTKAEATYRRAIDLRPHYWAGYNWLGGFYSGRGQYAQALEMFKRVIEITPDNPRGYNNAGGIYILKGDFEKAIRQFERSVEIKPSFAGYSNLGTAYFFQRRFSDSVSAYMRALQLNDRDYVTWGNLGDAQYFAPGQRASCSASYQKAIEIAKEALKVNPDDAGALGSMAMYYAMLGEKNQAESYMQRAVALKPAGPDVWWQASVVYAQSGQADATLSALQSALAAGLSSSYITSAAYFENLHDDPRFQQLIRSAQKIEQH